MKHTRRFLYLLVLGCIIDYLPVSAQSYNVFDSSVISAKNMPQQKEFWNNTYNFPAKPRDKWEIGASLGMLTISSDIPAILPTFGFEAHVRKAFGYIFSLRMQYINGSAKGLMWQPSAVNTKNPAWLDNSISGFPGNLPNGMGYNAQYRDGSGNVRPLSPTLNGGKSQSVYQNYKTHIQDLSLQGIVSINNIRFNKNRTNLTIYGGGGLGITGYHVMVNALDESKGKNYTDLFDNISFSGNVTLNSYSDRKKILKLLKDGMDNTYETEAESEGNRRGKIGKNTVMPTGTILMGLSYRLSKNINIALEDRHTIIKTDLLDGQQWQVQTKGDAVLTRDYDSYNFLSLGLNLNLGAKAVEPLWWLNPVDYAYNELNTPKHMKLPKPVFDDTDGDGVLDQLDREPNTPAGCPVDAHGVSKDTDGDGVPDCKDKQLITPTDCQPVDADGVGKCPEPECCNIINKLLDDKEKKVTDCPTDYPSIRMKGLLLDKDSKMMLEATAQKLKDHPACTITITAYPKANKHSQSVANKKLETIKNYLIEKSGISADRIMVNLVIDGGDADTIDFR